MRRRRNLAGLAAAVGVMALPAAASADTLVANDPDAKAVVASPGVLVYVGQDSASHDILLRQRKSRIRRLRARAGADIRDVDAGSNRRGRTTLAYTRCSDAFDVGSCHLYTYVIRTNHAARVRGTSRRGCGEYGVSISRGSVAYLRTGARKRCKPGIWLKRPGRKAKRIARRKATTTDFARRRIVFDSSRRGKPTIEAMTLRGKARVIARFNGAGSGDDLLDPTIYGRNVYWAERNAISADAEDGPSFRIRRRSLRGTGRTRSQKIDTTGYTGFALRRGQLVYSAFSDTDPGGIFRVRPRFR